MRIINNIIWGISSFLSHNIYLAKRFQTKLLMQIYISSPKPLLLCHIEVNVRNEYAKSVGLLLLENRRPLDCMLFLGQFLIARSFFLKIATVIWNRSSILTFSFSTSPQQTAFCFPGILLCFSKRCKVTISWKEWEVKGCSPSMVVDEIVGTFWRQ